jgi:hypothetical protein
MELSIARPDEVLWFVLLLGLVSYRLSKLVATDKWWEPLRDSLIVKLVQKPSGGFRESGVRHALSYLLGCQVCVGVWVSFLLAGLSLVVVEMDGPLTFLVAAFGIAGAQTFLAEVSAP